MSKKIKILVACHKDTTIYSDEVYVPIQVGRALSQVDLGYLTDDKGVNISLKNPRYCELTATFWAWKNLGDIDYLGLQHYRRYFETKYTDDNIDSLLCHYDIVLAKPIIHTIPLEYKMARIMSLEDEQYFFRIIKEKFPDYEQAVIDYLYDYKDYPYNMFVCKRELFVEYAKWLFAVLSECEKCMKESPYPGSNRLMGYIGEFLLPIFCIRHKLKIKEEYVVSMLGEKKPHHNFRDHIRYLLVRIHNFYKRKPSSLKTY